MEVPAHALKKGTRMTLPTKSKSKFRRLYGMSLREMAEKWGRSYQAFYDLHKRGRLETFLKDPDKFRRERFKMGTSKYIRKYGMTGTQLSEMLGLRSSGSISELDQAGLLDCCVWTAKQRKKGKNVL